MKMPRTNPPSYDLLVILRATLSNLEARRRPLSSKQEIVRHALALRIQSLEEMLRITAPGEKKPVSSYEPESVKRIVSRA
jgi:hypothetical protein